MIQKIRVPTSKGICEYKFLPTAAALQAAADAGEVAVGEEIVYRNNIVLVLEDFNLLIVEQPNGASWTFMCGG